jgi:hypothetical protein
MIKTYIFSTQSDNSFVLLSDYKKLEEQLAVTKRELGSYKHSLWEHCHAGSIFQPGGKYCERANLSIGCNTITKGIEWMDKEIESLTQSNKELIDKEDRAMKLCEKWHERYMECKNEFIAKVEFCQKFFDKMVEQENKNLRKL